MQGDIKQAALADGDHRRHAGNGLGVEPAIGSDQAQPAGTFGDQLAAIRQESQAPGVFQAFGDDCCPERLGLAGKCPGFGHRL